MEKRFIAVDASRSNATRAAFDEAFYGGEYRAIRTAGWASTVRPADTLELPGTIERDNADAYGRSLFVRGEFGAWIVYVRIEPNGAVQTSASAASVREAAAALALIREAFPDDTPHERFEVPFRLWMQTPHGPRAIVKPVAAHDWPQVAGNYPPGVQERLEPLLLQFRPAVGGQLLLMQGPPGTGKTHLLRTLAWEWRDWCAFEYIADPEVFFGESAAYMLSVLLEHGAEEPPPKAAGADPTWPPPPERWRILVLEDTGELLTVDSKQRNGQGLSRLLNVVDGIIGQGLRVLVLITTNEELGQLHAAATRPGRCAAKIEFESFNHAEADTWRGANGIAARGNRGTVTLADLFAEREGWQVERPTAGAGFRA